MNIKCLSCMQRLKIPDSSVGKRVKCPKCNNSFATLPKKLKEEIPCALKKTKKGFQTRYSCPSCKCKLRSDENEMGHVIPCPSCGTRFRAPGRNRVDELKIEQKRQFAVARKQAKLDDRKRQDELAERRRHWRSKGSGLIVLFGRQFWSDLRATTRANRGLQAQSFDHLADPFLFTEWATALSAAANCLQFVLRQRLIDSFRPMGQPG